MSKKLCDFSWTPGGRAILADDAERHRLLAHIGRAKRFHAGSALLAKAKSTGTRFANLTTPNPIPNRPRRP